MSSDPTSPTLNPEVPNASSDIENNCLSIPSAQKGKERKSSVMDSAPTIPPESVPPIEASKRQAPNFTSKSRGRIVSLDRDMLGTDFSLNIPGSAVDNDIDDNSTVTSDGESSYFAKDLPSPKSGRNYSFSDAASASSAPARAGLYRTASYRESDASLSFSDDDDDDVHVAERINNPRSPLLPPPIPRGNGIHIDEVPMYHQCGIIRMHSASSLNSSNSGAEGQFQAKGVPGLYVEDDESDAELVEIDPQQSRISSRMSDRPSGRNPPASLFAQFFSSPINPQPSPPTILSHGYPDLPTLPHPQPQPLGENEMLAWMTAGNAAAQQLTQQGHPHFTGYGATFVVPPHQLRISPTTAEVDMSCGNSIETTADSRGSGSHGTLPMVYSDDEETDEGIPVRKLAGGNRQLRPSGARAFDEGFRGNANVDNINKKSFEKDGDDKLKNTSVESGIGASVIDTFRDNTPRSDSTEPSPTPEKDYLVYWQRWMMLSLMSALNLLSDWTCYSVAPIAMLTSEAFGKIDPEQLVVVFLCANVVATASEPIILSRLGLRRTVVFGSLLLMMGSVIKSGGFPPIIASTLEKGHGEWRVYLGFFLVGLSQPLYQCTPALLSASWFPERERTLATGVALNANQLGIGFAFIFGTLLVSSSDDIVPYFGLLSIVSTLSFIGTLLFFDDAPPTPPSDTARVIRGTFEWRLPNADQLWKSVRILGSNSNPGSSTSRSAPNLDDSLRMQDAQLLQRPTDLQYSVGSADRTSMGRKPAAKSAASATRRRTGPKYRTTTEDADTGHSGSTPLQPPSSASTIQPIAIQISSWEHQAIELELLLPSPMLTGKVGQDTPSSKDDDESPSFDSPGLHHQPGQPSLQDPSLLNQSYGYPPQGMPMYQYPSDQLSGNSGFYGGPPPPWPPQLQHRYYDHHFQQNPLPFLAYPPQQLPSAYTSQPPHGYFYYPAGNPYYPQIYPNQYLGVYDPDDTEGPPIGTFDDGAEPTLTITDHHLDINIRDDQVILSIRACISRPGFIHALAAFTASGIVINTLSTFMDYLVRLNGAGREYVGIVGGLFQFVIMVSSLIIGKQTDKTRAYYSVTIGMLVLGAFGLAECGVSLDADRGGDVRWSLIIVACLVGPLQPVSTELGVEVAYPLSENTVLVIQQLFSNLLSALFIPFFKALKDIGTERIDATELYERPAYTFSFYLLIVIHASVTVFFATFNGRYLRYEHELAKKAKEERKLGDGSTDFNPTQADFNNGSFDRSGHLGQYSYQNEGVVYPDENQPLMRRVGL